MTHPGPGCALGPHVFSDKTPEDLHRRHPFSLSAHNSHDQDSVLDVAALDCEMIYTTGGMRVARVSVVDGDGKEVFDQFVRMDEGVEVVDYITRHVHPTPGMPPLLNRLVTASRASRLRSSRPPCWTSQLSARRCARSSARARFSSATRWTMT